MLIWEKLKDALSNHVRQGIVNSFFLGVFTLYDVSEAMKYKTFTKLDLRFSMFNHNVLSFKLRKVDVLYDLLNYQIKMPFDIYGCREIGKLTYK